MANASHIVGGEVTYKCLGNHQYQIEVDIYEDCINGSIDAIAMDNPAFIGIFTDAGQAYIIDTSVYRQYTIVVPPNFSNACVLQPPPTCLNKVAFIRTYTIDNDSTGFYVVYQRCCRNAQIVSIYNPGNTGATYFAHIPRASQAQCNNSAYFKNYPPQIICDNNPLYYDNSAIDPDGDSLTYELCAAYQGGDAQHAKPFPSPPPYDSVQYKPPYSSVNPLRGSPGIQIDLHTGILTTTPNLIGRFVVSVCCNEYRNGVLINTVHREFQFVVTNCSKAVVANIPQLSTDFNTYIVQCQDYTVHFQNLSTGGFSYHWDFGVPNSVTDTSSDRYPTFTYPDTGTYVVSLVVNRGSTCPDSIQRLVKVYPRFHSNFGYSGLPCPGGPIQFYDSSTSTYGPVTSWYWKFGDNDSIISVLPNPVHTYLKGGTYDVVLISHNKLNCVDTVTKQVFIEKFFPFAGNDTTIVKGESINFNASGGSSYTWTPSTYLNISVGSSPTGYYPDTGHILYKVHITSELGCSGDAYVRVYVVGQASFYVPTAFTPNGDGRNDIFRIIGVGYRQVIFFRVFNRWGQMVYNNSTFGIGWDGTYYGKPLEIGTYYWEANVIDRFGKNTVAKGDVELIR